VAIVMMLTILGLEAPFIPYAWREGVSDYRLPLYLVPQGLPMALAISVTLGLLFGLDGRPASRQVSRGLLMLAFVASVVSFVDLAWVTPASNQAFTAAAAGNPGVVRGVPEALGDLWQLGSPDFYFRTAFALGPLMLSLLALAVVGAQPARWVTVASGLVIVPGYYILIYSARNLAPAGWLHPAVAAWLPNVLLAAVAAGLMLTSRRHAHAAG
jgi:lipopolysaccharide export LptBFGC system permease protein LptF